MGEIWGDSYLPLIMNIYILYKAQSVKPRIIDDTDQHYRCAKYGVYWVKYDRNIGGYV